LDTRERLLNHCEATPDQPTSQTCHQAALRVSGLELGGLFGSLLAGRISDLMISKSGGKGGNVGKRVQVPRARARGCRASPLSADPEALTTLLPQ